MKRIFLTEEEKDDLSKKHEEIDRKLMNFLLRRHSIEEKALPSRVWNDTDDLPPFSWREVHFVDFPRHRLGSYMSRKDM